MTYIISGNDPRAGLRGGLSGFGGLGAALPPGGGDGTRGKPFGGLDGFGEQSEFAISALVMDGMTFTDFAFETGFAVNDGHRYIIAKGHPGKKFYKFYMTGTSTFNQPPNDRVKNWFNGRVGAAQRQLAAQKASAPGALGPTGTLNIDPNAGFNPFTGGAGSGVSGASTGGTTAVIAIGAAVAVAAVVLLKKKRG